MNCINATISILVLFLKLIYGCFGLPCNKALYMCIILAPMHQKWGVRNSSYFFSHIIWKLKSNFYHVILHNDFIYSCYIYRVWYSSCHVVDIHTYSVSFYRYCLEFYTIKTMQKHKKLNIFCLIRNTIFNECNLKYFQMSLKLSIVSKMH